MASSRFVYVTYIRTTPEKLWRALIEPEFTRRFWLEIEPQRKLVLSWRNELFPEVRAEGFSRLSYELEQQGESVKLTVIHEMDKPDSKLIGSTSGGWPLILASLKSLLETGEPLEQTRRWPEGI
jgi:uncharacterized protein YndB with AHSA1/START domain